MDWGLIWEKIKEFSISFYNFAMTQGESRFMLVDYNILQGGYIPKEARFFFIGSFVVMSLLAILACDSFRLFHPIEGIKEWPNKISIVKVIFFSAAVFSLHTFYKILIALSGQALHANASIAALDCLGSYINPISLMIYAFAVSTITFRKGWVQAMFLGWAIFLTPAAMSFSSFTNEHIMLYSVAGAFGILGAICYIRLSPYTSCFVMYIGYFIAKFFMIYYSDEVLLLTADNWLGKIAQYMACMQMDVILCVLLMLILFGYQEITTDKADRKVKSDIVLSAIVVVFMAGTIFFSNTTEVKAIQLSNKSASVATDSFGETSEAVDEVSALERLELFVDEYSGVNYAADDVIIFSDGDSYSASSTLSDHTVDNLFDCNERTNWQEGVDGSGIGESIEITYSHTHEVAGLAFYMGSWVSDKKYTKNNRPSKITLQMDDREFELEFSDEKKRHYVYFSEPVDINNIKITIDEVYRGTAYDDTVISEINIFPSALSKLIGVWKGDAGSVLTLYEGGRCDYVDGTSGKGSGKWKIDGEKIRINTSALPYEIYGKLEEGMNTTSMTIQSTSDRWRDEVFEKQK